MPDGQVHNVVIHNALFYERHKCRRGLAVNIELRVLGANHCVIVITGDRNLGCDDTNIVCLVAGVRDALCSRLDNAHNRNIRESQLQALKAAGRDCIAGDYHHLHVLRHKEVCNLINVVSDG